MQIAIVTIFPQMFDSFVCEGMTRRALEVGQLQLEFRNPRDFTEDNHRQVDDRPYGGGPGMVMMAEPLDQAISSARAAVRGRVIYLSPQGRRLEQKRVRELAGEAGLVLLAGRYEGVDERVLEAEIDEEISIGDYVLSGGELPAMVLIEALVRYLPGVLGNEDSVKSDSFSAGLLDWPHYTRPEVYGEDQVPPVLLSGHHEEIRRWRMKQALGRTWQKRPELLRDIELTDEQRELLDLYRRESHVQES
ncbi:MAG: tRNA (guanosine(37)-N1)-methyltransferase TrmD [Arenicellales bacterium]|jgi:tRNA (guanine37-N1)-methyltransferase|nr:tRNA (guanosine(37)-N1)-methyltransferase TrmD [Arenicellales bacterium]